MASEQSAPETPLSDLLEDLYYPSESDEPVSFETYTAQPNPPLSISQLKELLQIQPEVRVEERPESEFWEPVLTDQEWYGEEEKKRTARFQALQKAIQQQLTDRQLFRVGETEIDLYLLGRQKNQTWAGLKTRIIET